MQWGQSSYILALIGLLVFVSNFAVIAFRSKDAKKSGLLGLQFLAFSITLALLSLAFGTIVSSVALSIETSNTKSIGLGAWACGRQVDIKQESYLSGVFHKNNSYYYKKSVKVRDSETSTFLLQEVFENSGIGVDTNNPTGNPDDKSTVKFTIPVSNEFEFSLSSKSQTDLLFKSLSYEGTRSGPNIRLGDGDLNCVDESRWNVFILTQVSDREYESTHITPEQIATTQVELEHLGSDSTISKCIVLDYDAPLDVPQKACKTFLDKKLKLKDKS